MLKTHFDICSQRCYPLKCLKRQDIPAKQLNAVFCAIVMSRIQVSSMLCLPGVDFLAMS